MNSEATRVRREVEHALGLMPGSTPTLVHELPGTVDRIAETLATLRAVLDMIEQHAPAELELHTQLGRQLSYWAGRK